jgi:hypothetical protein
MRIKNINLENIIISDAEEGIKLSQAEDVNIKNVKIKTLKNKENLQMSNVKNVTIDEKKYDEVNSKGVNLEL